MIKDKIMVTICVADFQCKTDLNIEMQKLNCVKFFTHNFTSQQSETFFL